MNVTTPKKQWQTTVYTSKGQDDPHTFYDQSLIDLRTQVYSWLMATQPTYMRSGGIYEKDRGMWSTMLTSVDQQAYLDFCERGLHIQRGPEYDNPGFIDGTFRLEYVRKTVKDDQPSNVNQMLERGWHILALEKSEDTGRTWYVLGHCEPDAF
jgi:hypothetical protein